MGEIMMASDGDSDGEGLMVIAATMLSYPLNDSDTNITTPQNISIGDGGGRSARHLSPSWQVLITVLYMLGIIGNAAALYIITKSETQRYRKQTFMLRCLTGNDLMALLGSLVLMNVHMYLPNPNKKWLCVSRVVIRGFGLGSGCVALVMALERWLALTQPFVYTKHVTIAVIRRTILGLWLLTLLLVCAPFVGFGLWWEDEKCLRYRYGTKALDRVYAYLIFAYGMVMCAVIVGCNLMVIRVLCRMRERLMPRRHSRSSCRSASSTSGDPGYNHATPEELSFAWLMAVLSISFVVCWVPQLMTILIGQTLGQESKGILSTISRLCDIFILLNFLLDPFMYVLFRRHQRYGNRHVRKLLVHLCPRRFQDQPPRPMGSDSLRSSSNVSHNNTNGTAKCRGHSRRDIPLVPKGRSAAGSRYPPMPGGVRKNMSHSNSSSPPHRLPPLNNHLPNPPLDQPEPPSPSLPLLPISRTLYRSEDSTITPPEETNLDLNPTPPKCEPGQLVRNNTSQSWTDLHKDEYLDLEPCEYSDMVKTYSPKYFKRWSFCYGEVERLEFLPNESQKAQKSVIPASQFRWKLSLWRSHRELLSKKIKALLQS